MRVSGGGASGASGGAASPDDGAESALIGQRVPLGKGITGLAALTQEVQIGAATFKDVKQSERHAARATDPTAVLAAPMMVGETLVGVITAGSFRTHASFTPEHAALYARTPAAPGLLVAH